jgi:hypothetical protein
LRSMLMRYDLESSIRRKIPKHNESRAGDEDMPVMRYERRTVEVGRRLRIAFGGDALTSVVCVECNCEASCSCDDVRKATFRWALWWTCRGDCESVRRA